MIRWAQYSNCYIGDIVIESDVMSARLIVLVETSEEQKRQFTTVVNPDDSEIKLIAGEILEVVVYQEGFSGTDHWSFKWDAVDIFQPLNLEFLGHDTCPLNIWRQIRAEGTDDRAELPYSRLPRITKDQPALKQSRQHHFWFRFDNNINDMIEIKQGKFYVGRLTMSGWPYTDAVNQKMPITRSIGIVLDLNRKYIQRVMQSFLLQPKNLYNAPPKLAEGPKQEQKFQSVHPSRTYYDNGNVTTTISKKSNNTTLQQMKKVDIVEIDYGSLDQDCKVVSALGPPPERATTYHHNNHHYNPHNTFKQHNFNGCGYGVMDFDHYD
jgi:hypothetical protein